MTRVDKNLALLALAGIGLAACADGPTGVDAADCAFDGVQALQPGDVLEGIVGTGTLLCIESIEGAEYALLPFVGEFRDTLLRADLLIESSAFLTDDAPFVSERSLLESAPMTASTRAGAPVSSRGVMSGSGDADAELRQALRYGTSAFHRSLRRNERSLLRRYTPARPSVVAPGRMAASAPRPVLPLEGDLLQLSVSAICDAPEWRTGRVVSITDHAIVVTDEANPAGGFTDETLRGFGEEFDEVAYPLVTSTFADPTDLDANSRVILFFTTGVNDKAPAGGTGIVAGYFWGGDLFSATEGEAPCASSNEGEVLYLAVPDISVPERVLGPVTINTAAHELQHLINASRRVHVLDASQLEEVWMNEGLSLIAEELLFYETTGLEPRSNLSASELRADPQITELFNRFAEGNVYRYNVHLQRTRTSSPIGQDGLAMRGAAWSFLRYAADRDPGSDAELFRQLGDTRATGLGNLGIALDIDPMDWIADWGVGVLTDDLLPDIDPRFRHESWNMRALVPALRPTDEVFPLQILPLDRPGSFLIQLRSAGVTAHPVFRLPAGRSDVTLRSDGYNGTIRFALVRVD